MMHGHTYIKHVFMFSYKKKNPFVKSTTTNETRMFIYFLSLAKYKILPFALC